MLTFLLFSFFFFFFNEHLESATFW